jgi:hypothetical protein
MQTVIVRQKMSNLDEEGRLRKVLYIFVPVSQQTNNCNI